MNIHDELSDSEVLDAAARLLSGMPIAVSPDVDTIVARGRARRRRRLSAVAGVPVAAAATALALGLTGVLSPAAPPDTIRTVSFTLVSNNNGTATLTINPGELLDTATLQNDLKQYGIPAMVTSGSFCTSDPEPPGGAQAWSVAFETQPPTLTFNPAGIPAGDELSIGDFQLSSGAQQADLTLISTSSYSCTSAPVPDPMPQHGLQLEVPAASARS